MKEARAVIGWAAPVEPWSRLCAIVERSGGSFHTACRGRFDASERKPGDPPVNWRWYPGVDSPIRDERCAACATYVLERHGVDLSGYVRRMLSPVERGLAELVANAPEPALMTWDMSGDEP